MSFKATEIDKLAREHRRKHFKITVRLSEVRNTYIKDAAVVSMTSDGRQWEKLVLFNDELSLLEAEIAGYKKRRKIRT